MKYLPKVIAYLKLSIKPNNKFSVKIFLEVELLRVQRRPDKNNTSRQFGLIKKRTLVSKEPQNFARNER